MSIYDSFRAFQRQESFALAIERDRRPLQSANVGKSQPAETPEKSANTKDDGREDELEMERRLA